MIGDGDGDGILGKHGYACLCLFVSFFVGTNLYYSRSQATLRITKFDNAIRA